MNINSFLSRCPVVREEDLELCQIVKVAGTSQAVPFKARIMYLWESSSKLGYCHGGKLLTQGATFNDYYGYLTSTDNAIEEAKQRCNILSITTESTLTLSVELIIQEKVVIRPEPLEISYGRTKYQAVNRDWLLYVPDQIKAMLKAKDFDEEFHLRQPLMLTKSDNHVFKAEIWSSKFPDRLPDIKAWVQEQGF